MEMLETQPQDQAMALVTIIMNIREHQDRTITHNLETPRAIVARQAIRITAIAAQADALIPLFLFLASLNAFWRIFNLQWPSHILMISANFINIRLCLRAAQSNMEQSL